MHLEIKSIAEDGTFEGLLSPYGNVDQGNDVVEAGAFTESLKSRGTTVPLLWQHDQKCPIGTLELLDTPQGLQCKGSLVLDTDASGAAKVPEAQKAYALMKAKVVRGLSIGYDAVKAQVKSGVRYLKQIDLYEGSVVTFPMNLDAQIASVKARERKGEYADTLNDIQLVNQRYSMVSALDSALAPLVWSGATSDELLTAAGAIIDEFKAMYLQFLPEYWDYLSREYGMDAKAWRSQIERKHGSDAMLDPRRVQPLEVKALPAVAHEECAPLIADMRSLLK